jgi:hypothetical protein
VGVWPGCQPNLFNASVQVFHTRTNVFLDPCGEFGTRLFFCGDTLQEHLLRGLALPLQFLQRWSELSKQ